MSMFGEARSDDFNPEYGGVEWKRRLNNWLEDANMEIQPVAYGEEGKPPMQITQENTMIFWNTFADELDTIAVMYDQDNGESTWYFREKFKNIPVPEGFEGEGFDYVAMTIGQWCLQTITLYPMQNVVDIYETMHGVDVPDHLPEDFS